jgi:hypothetical protein
MSFKRFVGNTAEDLASVGGRATGALLKSIATSLVCRWYQDSAVLRYKVGEAAYNTERHTILNADTNMTIEHMKWKILTQGVYSDEQQYEGRNGNKPTVVAWALIKQNGNRGAPKGDLQMITYEEGAGDEESVPLYTQGDDVIIADMFRLWGWSDEREIESGFLNSSYPGPIHMTPGDKLQLVALATDNYDDPTLTRSSVKAYITGTVSWQMAEINQFVNNGVTENI